MKAAGIAAVLALAAFSIPGTAAQSSNNGAAIRDQEGSGTVCVLPNSPDRPERISPGGDYNPATLTVRIDHGETQPWPHKKSIKIENLSLSGRHLIVLTSDSKPIQSFWFRFSDYKETKLCMAFDGYQGVQFGDKHTALWCRCN